MTAYSQSLARARLEALGVLAAKCEACGRVEWQIADLPSAVFAVDVGEEEIQLLDDGIGARGVAVVCGHCGNTRFHDWHVLAAPE